MIKCNLVRKQSVVDKLWQKANSLVENYDGEPYGSRVYTDMNLRILEDNLMTTDEFWSDAYDEDLDAIHHFIWTHIKDHPKSPYRYD
jgi:hypothetical protein